MPGLVDSRECRAGLRAQRFDLFDAHLDPGELRLRGLQVVTHRSQLAAHRVALRHRGDGIVGVQAALRIAQRHLDAVGPARDTRLPAKRPELPSYLAQQVVEPRQVRFGVRQLAQRTFLALAVLEDARSLFDERAVAAGIGPQNRVQPPLPDDHVHLLPEPGVAQQLLDVEQTAGRAVDRVFGTPVAEDGAADRHLAVVDVQRVVGVVDRQAHLCAAEWRAGGRSREDHVLHRRAAQVLRALFTHHPGERVDDVRLAGTVRTDDRGDARLESQRRGGCERFEAAQREFLEIHVD